MNKDREPDRRRRLELCNWQDELPVNIQCKGDHYSAKAMSRGFVTEVEIGRRIGLDPDWVGRILEEVRKSVRHGFDVKLCGGVHFYACVTKLKTPFLAAKTMGAFRKSVSDKAVRPSREGEPISQPEIDRLCAKAKARLKYIHVTPDTVIVCPTCGSDLRVGKVLA